LYSDSLKAIKLFESSLPNAKPFLSQKITNAIEVLDASSQKAGKVIFKIEYVDRTVVSIQDNDERTDSEETFEPIYEKSFEN
jgi:hypothetical protein